MSSFSGKEVDSAIQNLIAENERIAKKLFDDFRIGDNPYNVGPRGFFGMVTPGQAYVIAKDLRKKLDDNLELYTSLHEGELKRRTLNICAGYPEF